MTIEQMPSEAGTLTEANDPMLLSEAAARELLRGAPWQRFAVLGDSVAAGTGDPWPGYADVPWADRLAATMTAVRPDLVYLNTGVYGATIDQVRREQLSTILDFQPDLVHVSCGGNDLFYGSDLTDIERDLDSLCAVLAGSGAQLSLFTLANAFTDRLRRFQPSFAAYADIVRRVAANHDAILTEFWDHPARLRTNWLSADHIHLTKAGHAVVTTEVTRSLGRAIHGA
ncbi:SGNH/GDSL hydrolase family protein [Gordonia sp. C13]|uniref:SGNH/GDSL hydrolase family protein n=1 Tax=Gordonia sp. C13 TaxID=2935078 RepID=UPI00200A46FC|nr:SGNH/GDSL hydrolase family protein [Gordonia sp. C13]MCK8614669.1 SGNH/GDSL hydrolase family protein [Gordonia sp. C13]